MTGLVAKVLSRMKRKAAVLLEHVDPVDLNCLETMATPTPPPMPMVCDKLIASQRLLVSAFLDFYEFGLFYSPPLEHFDIVGTPIQDPSGELYHTLLLIRRALSKSQPMEYEEKLGGTSPRSVFQPIIEDGKELEMLSYYARCRMAAAVHIIRKLSNNLPVAEDVDLVSGITSRFLATYEEPITHDGFVQLRANQIHIETKILIAEPIFRVVSLSPLTLAEQELGIMVKNGLDPKLAATIRGGLFFLLGAILFDTNEYTFERLNATATTRDIGIAAVTGLLACVTCVRETRVPVLKLATTLLNAALEYGGVLRRPGSVYENISPYDTPTPCHPVRHLVASHALEHAMHALVQRVVEVSRSMK